MVELVHRVMSICVFISLIFGTRGRKDDKTGSNSDY
jgi:hypothetical protein